MIMGTWIKIYNAACVRSKYYETDKDQMRKSIDHMYHVLLDEEASDREYWLHEYGLN
jgi:hypothetical protein